ncbi:tetratricopeptide repeat protein 16-like [Chiloscyllium plagiosum]|uniref:tetratricopeptide repeat protein 16-like n=1 Tax=Chiloscyllium plagiosum TaxID=36176 RepID=UPI001CB8179B|nr:tetratricopeptide repeat protein 16-like [Chiloscyllium plagiosum]
MENNVIMEESEEPKQREEHQSQSLIKVDDLMPEIDVFPTALSEEQLEAATEKARQNFFGSSGIFHLDDIVEKNDTVSIIINDRAKEHCLKGNHFLQLGDLEEAVISFSKAIALNPQMKEFYLRRAEAYLQIGDFQSSIVNYRMASSLDPSDEDLRSQIALTLYIQGQSLFEMKLYMDALEVFVQASEMQLENHHYHMRSVEALIALGRLEDSLQLVNEQLENVKTNPELYILRARLHDHFNQIANCYQDVSSALALDPTHQEALSLMATLVSRAEEAKMRAINKSLIGNLKSALDNINEAIDNNPNKVDYFVFRGTLYRKFKNFNAAIDDYLFILDKLSKTKESDIYLETQKQLLLTYNDFAVHCYHKGFFEEAITLLNLCIRGEKQQKGLYINRGGKDDDTCSKEEYCLQGSATAQISLTVSAYIKFSFVSFGTRNYQQAEQQFTHAIESNPQVSQYYLHRAKTRAILQQISGSQEDAIISLLLDVRNKEVIPLLTHLFPGKSRDEILASKIVASARATLNASLYSCASPVRKKIQERRTLTTNQACENVDREKDVQKAESNFVPCIKEADLYKEIVERKKMLTQEIRDSLHYRKPLLIDRPNISMILKPLANPNQSSEAASPNKLCKWKSSTDTN